MQSPRPLEIDGDTSNTGGGPAPKWVRIEREGIPAREGYGEKGPDNGSNQCCEDADDRSHDRPSREASPYRTRGEQHQEAER